MNTADQHEPPPAGDLIGRLTARCRDRFGAALPEVPSIGMITDQVRVAEAHAMGRRRQFLARAVAELDAALWVHPDGAECRNRLADAIEALDRADRERPEPAAGPR
ncbi:hypothetical protein ACIHFE_31615 [Streptomyces sp. NPDC052396]|uniref:hypothetical protein n=1 Tax=Streptomyces sp. NPDC052396 TaxID=3365689 RepID=UPI0037D60B5A